MKTATIKPMIIGILAAVLMIYHGTAMENGDEKSSHIQENLMKLRLFQQKTILVPSEEWKEKVRAESQKILDFRLKRREIESDLFVLRAVAGIVDVASELEQIRLESTTHRLTFVDFDETIFLGKTLGLLRCALEKLGKNDRVQELMLKYKFKSLENFQIWGATNFPVPIVQTGVPFYNHKMIDTQTSTILEKWHKQGTTILGLTKRDFETRGVYTQAGLDQENINFAKLNSVPFEIKMPSCNQAILHSGVIYSPNNNKADILEANNFIESYLENLIKESQHPSHIEIILLDDSIDVFENFFYLSSVNRLHLLEKKFNLKIKFRGFLLYQQYWESLYFTWNYNKHHNPDFSLETMAIQALEEFLITFKTPLDPVVEWRKKADAERNNF